MAAAKKAMAKSSIGAHNIVVCNLSGHGLKQPEAIEVSEQQLTPIAPQLDALRERILSARE